MISFLFKSYLLEMEFWQPLLTHYFLSASGLLFTDLKKNSIPVGLWWGLDEMIKVSHLMKFSVLN